MRIRFGRFELDDERYRLSLDGEPVELRPKVFDLLVTLVRERRRVVRREELFASLWSTTTVGAGSLAGLVNELRHALGEDGRGPSSIRTVHARGYQFAADVEVLGGASPESAAPASIPSPAAATERPVATAPPEALAASEGSAATDPSASPDERSAASIASRLQRAFFEVQREGPRALVALIADRRQRAIWLAAAGARARAIGFESRWLVVPAGPDGGKGDFGPDPAPAAVRAAGRADEAGPGRAPIVLCLDVEGVVDWRRAGGLRRCLDLMGRAPVLVLAAIAATRDERTVRVLVDGDPRVDCGATDGEDGVPGREGRGADGGADLVAALQRLASSDRAAFERALRGMGFEARSAPPVRTLRRVDPGRSRSDRAPEREVG